MQVQRSAAVSLLVALGALTAGKWALPKVLGKLKKIDDLVDDSTTLAEDDDALLKAVRKANEAEENIEIEDDTTKDKPKSKKSKSKKAAKKAKAETDEEEEDGETEDSDEEEEADEEGGDNSKKATKKGKDKAKVKKTKEKKAKGPGVIDSIVSILKGASMKEPVTKEEIHKQLCELFPERNKDSMKTTVGIQVPSRLGKDREITVKKNENGYWIPKNKK